VIRSYPEGYAARAQDLTGGWFDPCPNYSAKPPPAAPTARRSPPRGGRPAIQRGLAAVRVGRPPCSTCGCPNTSRVRSDCGYAASMRLEEYLSIPYRLVPTPPKADGRGIATPNTPRSASKAKPTRPWEGDGETREELRVRYIVEHGPTR